MPDDAAPAVPENVPGLDSGFTADDRCRRVVRSFGLPSVTPERRAAILRMPEVAGYFRTLLGPRWRWPVMAEVTRQ